LAGVAQRDGVLVRVGGHLAIGELRMFVDKLEVDAETIAVLEAHLREDAA
jgi:hypothetical protein